MNTNRNDDKSKKTVTRQNGDNSKKFSMQFLKGLNIAFGIKITSMSPFCHICCQRVAILVLCIAVLCVGNIPKWRQTSNSGFPLFWFVTVLACRCLGCCHLGVAILVVVVLWFTVLCVAVLVCCCFSVSLFLFFPILYLLPF